MKLLYQHNRFPFSDIKKNTSDSQRNKSYIYMYVHIIIILFILGKYLIPTLRGRRASTPRKETKRKDEEKERDRARKGETSYPNPDKWCAHRKRKKEEKDRNGRGSQPSYLDHKLCKNIENKLLVRTQRK